MQLQPKTYDPHQPQSQQQQQHQRDGSDASSVYSHGNRLSAFGAYQAYHEQEGRAESKNPYDLPSIDESVSQSAVKPEAQPIQSNNLLAPAQPVGKVPRISEFYEAYYRNSQLGVMQPEPKKQPGAAF
jgi:hypothetical protein